MDRVALPEGARPKVAEYRNPFPGVSNRAGKRERRGREDPDPSSLCARSKAQAAAYLNLKSAVCVVPSLSVTVSWRQVPAQDESVFQT